jgi:ferredoxin
MISTLFLLCVISLFVASSSSFVIPITIQECNQRINNHQSLVQLYGWMDAFKNDETLGKPQNAGLKNGPNYNEQVTVNGIKVTNAVVGQKLTTVASRVRVKIPVNCQKGDCGTCMVNLNGRKVKACQTSLPAGKASITTL